MLHRTSTLVFALSCAAAIGCGESTDESGLMPGFDVPALQPGFTRYVAPIIKNIQPGQDVIYCQWISAPMDHDLTIGGFASLQSAHGHHVALYANNATPAVGTSRECTSNDMLSVRYAGASAGEGNGVNFELPEGIVFRIPKGTALMVNTHFINPTPAPIDGQAVVDLKLTEPTDGETVAGMFTNLHGSFSVAPNTQGAADTSCVVQEDLQIISFTNHMHEWGTSAYSEVIRGDGSKAPLIADATWSPERVFNPIFHSWPTSAPMLVKKGETIHTHCEWDNTTTEDLTFPKEMCVGIAFHFPGGREINCTDGVWDQ